MLILQVDDSMSVVNTSSGYDGPSQVSAKLASVSPLDNETIHTLSIGWCANKNTNASSGLEYPLSYTYFSHLNVDNFREAYVIFAVPLVMMPDSCPIATLLAIQQRLHPPLTPPG